MHQTMQAHQTINNWWQNYGGPGLPSIKTFSAAKRALAEIEGLEVPDSEFGRGMLCARLVASQLRIIQISRDIQLNSDDDLIRVVRDFQQITDHDEEYAEAVCLALARTDSVALVDLLEKKPHRFTRGFVSAALSISIALLGSSGGRFAANH